ncbi:MAG: Nif3-like dinuclear metal center hexameric protein, partial [Fuerstiella sp.]|nr:Nif3-like dinuclear metal center hexameric protein [Fuerstiella sp.]
MSTVSDVIAFLEKFAPPALAEDWDNVGLLVGREAVVVQQVMTCLTLTPDVGAEAVRRGVQLVVSHHPVLFRGTKKITDATSEGRMLLQLIENGLAVYSPHTSFDSAELGINQQLA